MAILYESVSYRMTPTTETLEMKSIALLLYDSIKSPLFPPYIPHINQLKVYQPVLFILL